MPSRTRWVAACWDSLFRESSGILAFKVITITISPPQSERTVFHWSALKGSADILERLLQNKDSVDLNCRDVEGRQ